MKPTIAALFIEKHAYLQYDFNMVNLGGKYLYEIEKNDNHFIVTRKINPQYCKGFFNITNSNNTIENVSAIVGQNGVGKSTLLDIIRRCFIDNTNALPHVKSILLVENEDQLLFYSHDIETLYMAGKKIKGISKNSLQTIYYSPHLDYRFNPNFDEIDYFDISLDKFIDLDLIDMEAMDTNEYGVNFPVKQELLFKNSLRQILFMTSSLVVEEHRFENIFDFPLHGNASLYFRGLITDKEPRNVPYVLREPLKELEERIESELNDHVKIRKIEKNNRTINEAEVKGYLLKRNLIRHLVSLLFKHMDRSNDYLTSVQFDEREFQAKHAKSAYELFLAFLSATRIPTPAGNKQAFDVKGIKSLFDKIYKVADSIRDGEQINQNEMICSAKDAIEILKLHRTVIYDISSYYNKQLKKGSKILRDLNFLVPDFIYYSPAEKRLSSGENALLNLFSKLYSFLDVKLNPRVNPKKRIKTFILLLDEADLGFHPVWKKKFVKAIISTLPYFFEKYTQTPCIQIIFTTHDPLTLSDLPSSNVVCLENRDNKVQILNSLKMLKTFGANITDLLANSFFVDDGLIGDFAKYKIQNIITWLKDEKSDESELYRKLIDIIDEPIVRKKLAEMYDHKMNSDLELSLIDRQIVELQKQKEQKLRHDKNTNK
ncbi:AAA family ATPase [Mucilaginibacter flavidus]|uniref:AAA family ATPase n=1 Tax=Mucilaginibacter flavidus TaxID=2949309 RepID=UPI002092864D|nr:AAA family ATPase [Mucilaginibacter flavidus]MCO5949797.1 AAA family ATPase [Mucilaginibacter flavidus]